MRSMSSLGCSEATVAADAVVAAFKSAGQAAVVAVADQQRKLILLARLDGAPYPSILVATKKAWTAARERKPSMDGGQASRAPGAGFDVDDFGDARYAGFGGGLSCIVGGEAVGAITVSGRATDEDIRLAELGFAALDMTTE